MAGAGREGGRGGRTHLLLALVIWPLTTHPFRDGAPFLPLIETPLAIWALIRFFHILHRKVFAQPIPALFRRLRPQSSRIAILFFAGRGVEEMDFEGLAALVKGGGCTVCHAWA